METEKIVTRLRSKFYYSIGFSVFAILFLLALPTERTLDLFTAPKNVVEIVIAIGFAFSMVDTARGLYLAERYRDIIVNKINLDKKRIIDLSESRGLILAACVIFVVLAFNIPLLYRAILIVIIDGMIYFLNVKTSTEKLFKRVAVVVDWSMFSDIATHQERIAVLVPIKGVDQQKWLEDFVAQYVVREKFRMEQEKEKIKTFSEAIRLKLIN